MRPPAVSSSNLICLLPLVLLLLLPPAKCQLWQGGSSSNSSSTIQIQDALQGQVFKSFNWSIATDKAQPSLVRVKRKSASDDWKPTSQVRPKRRLNERMRFVLMCQVLDGEPPINIKWFKDNKELSITSSGVLLEEQQLELLANDELGSSSLLFRRVQAQHSGNYTCLASNHFGSSAYSSLMSVKVAPSWRIEPQDQESVLGDQIIIDCQAFGNPSPFIRWKFAQSTGTKQQNSEHQAGNGDAHSASQLPYKLINSNHHVQTLENGSLAIRQASKEHEGSYLCEADNGVEPNLVRALNLQVHVQAHFFDEIQLIENSQQQDLGSRNIVDLQQAGGIRVARVVENANSARLLCQPIGDPPLTVEWLKEGQLIHTQTWHSTEQRPQELSSSRSSPELRYHVSSKQRSSQPNSSSRYQAVNLLESELSIGQVRRSDAGLYTCLARNAFGQAERKLRLLVQEPPEAPQVVDVAHISSRSIGLRWLAPFDGNSPILRYTVDYRKLASGSAGGSSSSQQQGGSNSDSNGDWIHTSAMHSDKIMPAKSDPVIGPQLGVQVATQQQQQQQQQQQLQQQVQHTIHDLEPLTGYSLRVSAVNAIGRSMPSVALSLRTEEEVPSVVASHVEAHVISSSSVRLLWTLSFAPEHELIEGFFVGYRSFEPAPASSLQVDGGKSSQISQQQHPKLVAEQSTFTYKTVRLLPQGRQQNSQAGGQSDPLKTDAIYLAPLSSHSKQVVLQPTGSGSFAPGGQLQVQQQYQLILVQTFELPLTGLERDTEYTVLIQCFNRKGAGPTSDPVAFRTFASDPPEKPLLSADEVTESSVKLVWRSLGDHAGQLRRQIDGYILAFSRLSSVGGRAVDWTPEPQLEVATNSNEIRSTNQVIQDAPADQWQSVQLNAQQRSHQLKNLECGTSYAMKIWAFNKIGKGEPSETLTVSTRGKAPVAPDRRSFLEANTSQVRLQLSSWYNGGCEIHKFVIHYRIRGQSEWQLVTNSVQQEQASLIIRDLQPATNYELLVLAQNQVGPTEVKYRFSTLDIDGRPLVSSSASGYEQQQDQDELAMDPNDEQMSTSKRRNYDYFRPAGQLLRQLLSWPLSFALSLCILIGLLLSLLLLGRFNSQARSSNSNSSGGSSSLSSTGSMLEGNVGHRNDLALGKPLQRPLGAATQHQQQANCSLMETPRPASLLDSNESQTMPSECQYRSLWPIQAPESSPNCCPNANNIYGQRQSIETSPSLYASIHKPAGSQQLDPQQQQQHCQLMQMLMLSGQQQQTGGYSSSGSQAATLGPRHAMANQQKPMVSHFESSTLRPSMQANGALIVDGRELGSPSTTTNGGQFPASGLAIAHGATLARLTQSMSVQPGPTIEGLANEYPGDQAQGPRWLALDESSRWS